MRIRTVDQNERPILDFHRCAMLPARKEASAQFGEVDPPNLDPAPGATASGVSSWDLSGYRDRTPGPHFDSIRPGMSFDIGDGDVVTSAPELARLTFNLAAVHHDRTATRDGRRLVYGGHTIGIAAAQATRAFPALVTVLAWHGCDHVGPVHEGDTLVSTVEVEQCDPLAAGGGARTPPLPGTEEAGRRRGGPCARLALRRAVRMKHGILNGLGVVEASAFVAAPLGGMTLAQLGADVIRVDPVAGALDQGRWPLAPNGASLFWAGMNKGKRSIRIDLKSPEGQELATALITRPGAGAGIVLTNLPRHGWMAYETLKKRRDDLIMVSLSGNADGTSEVDYTVNPATGFPSVTGPRGTADPVNSVLPAWDIAMGTLAAVGLLAADRHRTATGEGSLVDLALSDVALAMVANLGRLSQAEFGEATAGGDGNYLYGAFGRDFATADGRRIMVVALTLRQWRSLKEATGLGPAFADLASATGLDLDDEGDRYRARDAIAAILEPWFSARTLAKASEVLAAARASWGPYRTFAELPAEEPRVRDGHLFATIDQPGIGPLLTPASPLRFTSAPRLPPLPAPAPGEHTDEILADILGTAASEIGRLHDAGVVSGPA
jgi:2-methylfumaryl-CoA isomerase